MREDTSELRRLLEAATPGEWELGTFCDEIVCPNATDSFAEMHRISCKRDGEENAALIVAMRNALPQILDRLAVLEEVAEAARPVIKRMQDMTDEGCWCDDGCVCGIILARDELAAARAALARLDGEGER